MLDLIPTHWLDSAEIKELALAIAPEEERMQAALDDFFAQLFVDSATWALALWEAAYGLDANANSSYETRRNAIKARMKGMQTMTLPALQNIAEAWEKGTCTVRYEDAHLVLDVLGFDAAMESFQPVLRDIQQLRPAHIPIKVMQTQPEGFAQYTAPVIQIADRITI